MVLCLRKMLPGLQIILSLVETFPLAMELHPPSGKSTIVVMFYDESGNYFEYTTLVGRNTIVDWRKYIQDWEIRQSVILRLLMKVTTSCTHLKPTKKIDIILTITIWIDLNQLNLLCKKIRCRKCDKLSQLNSAEISNYIKEDWHMFSGLLWDQQSTHTRAFFTSDLLTIHTFTFHHVD